MIENVSISCLLFGVSYACEEIRDEFANRMCGKFNVSILIIYCVNFKRKKASKLGPATLNKTLCFKNICGFYCQMCGSNMFHRVLPLKRVSTSSFCRLIPPSYRIILILKIYRK